MKKMPRRIPLNGNTSACICARKFVFANSTPAAKAPAVSVRPKDLATAPIPTLTNNDNATNVSVDRVFATTPNIHCNKKDPTNITKPNPIAALAVKKTIAKKSVGPCPTTYGNTTNNGATNKSCSKSIEVAACPEFSPSHPRSFNTGKINAEVDNVPAKANTTASVGFRISINPLSNGSNRSKNCGAPNNIAAVITPVVNDICAKPKGK